jgi:protein-S-isoprenylcysteine O-methyltransferase Ste14
MKWLELRVPPPVVTAMAALLMWFLGTVVIALVMGGVYRLTRNPMYLAMLVVLAAWALVVSNFAAFLLLPLFVAYLNRFQILPEERALQARFGAEFERYRSSVRRWL